MRRRSIGLIAAAGAAVAVAAAGAGFTTTATAIPAAAVASTPIANGIQSMTAPQIVRAAATAAQAAGSAHVEGSAIVMGFPVTLSGDGVHDQGAAGTVTAMNHTVEVYATTDWVAVKADSTLLSMAGLPSTYSGKWVKLSKSQAASLLTGVLPATNIKSQLAKFRKAPGKAMRAITVGAVTNVDGQEVLPLTLAKAGVTVYIATTGEPLPVKVIVTKRVQATASFSNWGSATLPAAPAASDMVDYKRH